MDIKTIVLDYFASDNFQDFINKRYKDDSKVILPRNYFTHIRNSYGEFPFDEHVVTIDSADHDYDVSDLRKTDIVLDIGACIGAFSLKAARMCKHVYAVEPITTDILKNVILSNKVSNITVLDYALGKVEHNFMGIDYTHADTLQHKTRTLPELIKMCGGHVDFIKCDCEGGEWVIKPEDLKGVRVFEGEIHKYPNTSNFDEFKRRLSDAGFGFESRIFTLYNALMLVHARKKTTWFKDGAT